jgi:glycogen operon protein
MIGQILGSERVAVPAEPLAGKPIPQAAFVTSRGHCRPFGATPGPGGVNFAVFSRHAHAVALMLFADGQEEPLAEIPLDPHYHRTGDVWHIFVHDLGLDMLYGYRVQGPTNTKAGYRFQPKTILLDPYAQALSGGQHWGQPDMVPPLMNGTNGSAGVRARLSRRGRIILDDFDWEDDVPPRTPLSHTVIYELHVRGFTRHASSAVRYPGTYLGLCEKISYLKGLGVTAVQLMPMLEFDELEHAPHQQHAVSVRNYWGYSPVSFFAPKAGFAAQAGQELREFKNLVKHCHRAGIEVILDVVYNHTGEGNEHGPTLSFRGLDNAIYYMLDKEGRYYNFSGCGNTLNCNHPVVRDLIIDSLTYLVSELHVDGFRFDLAAILGRGANGKVLEDPPLIQHIAEHPVLAGTKLIAEAWDAAGLSQLGKFPAWGRWAELNGWFRDDVRRFLRSEPAATASVAKRICGSLDLYGDSSRHPYHSVNFITCHDGFTLNDLVSYNLKHNQVNGENNRDGWDDNISFNCGIEGPTDNPHVSALRQRQMRNFFTMLLVSQGVPFLLYGDEFGRTQRGNNNAYCQDNDISWVDWSLAEKNAGLLRFVKHMIALRRKHFAMSREQFVNRVSWHGMKIGDPDWTGQKRVLALQIQGVHGQSHLYVLFNAHWEWQKFELPAHDGQRRWLRLVDTNLASPQDILEEKDAVPLRPADHYIAAPRSAVILIAGV